MYEYKRITFPFPAARLSQSGDFSTAFSIWSNDDQLIAFLKRVDVGNRCDNVLGPEDNTSKLTRSYSILSIPFTLPFSGTAYQSASGYTEPPLPEILHLPHFLSNDLHLPPLLSGIDAQP